MFCFLCWCFLLRSNTIRNKHFYQSSRKFFCIVYAFNAGMLSFIHMSIYIFVNINLINSFYFTENLSNVDDSLGDLYLNEKPISNDDIEVSITYIVVDILYSISITFVFRNYVSNINFKYIFF